MVFWEIVDRPGASTQSRDRGARRSSRRGGRIISFMTTEYVHVKLQYSSLTSCLSASCTAGTTASRCSCTSRQTRWSRSNSCHCLIYIYLCCPLTYSCCRPSFTLTGLYVCRRKRKRDVSRCWDSSMKKSSSITFEDSRRCRWARLQEGSLEGNCMCIPVAVQVHSVSLRTSFTRLSQGWRLRRSCMHACMYCRWVHLYPMQVHPNYPPHRQNIKPIHHLLRLLIRQRLLLLLW